MDSLTDLATTEARAPRHRSGWQLIAEFRFEIALFVLLLATFAAVRLQDLILTREIVITPNSSTFKPRYYGDETHQGGSTVTVDPKRRLDWTCKLRVVYAYPYCGYELMLDHRTPDKGIDLSGLESVTIDMDYRGPSDTFRIYVKNFDPRYSKPQIPETLKFNKVEVSATPGHNIVGLKTSDFAVAEWWVTQSKIKPAMSHVQMDNVTELQFQTGTEAAPGTYRFKVNRITLHTRLISQAAWYAAILAVWALLIGLYLVYRLFKLSQDVELRSQGQAAALRLAEHAEESARRDYLTQLLNRSGVIDMYQPLATNRRGGTSFAVILLDIDHFKQINDKFGHRAGDQALAKIASVLTENCRASDIVGRWGGEEFLLICPMPDQEGAMQFAEKLRASIEAQDLGLVGHLTASFGVYCCGGATDQLEQLVSYADAALYAAKEQGRNRAVLYQPFMREAA